MLLNTSFETPEMRTNLEINQAKTSPRAASQQCDLTTSRAPGDSAKQYQQQARHRNEARKKHECRRGVVADRLTSLLGKSGVSSLIEVDVSDEGEASILRIN